MERMVALEMGWDKADRMGVKLAREMMRTRVTDAVAQGTRGDGGAPGAGRGTWRANLQPMVLEMVSGRARLESTSCTSPLTPA